MAQATYIGKTAQQILAVAEVQPMKAGNLEVISEAVPGMALEVTGDGHLVCFATGGSITLECTDDDTELLDELIAKRDLD
ncbi:MAG: hypothetical protein ABJZ55_20505 [Fuerstiella sp.]